MKAQTVVSDSDAREIRSSDHRPSAFTLGIYQSKYYKTIEVTNLLSVVSFDMPTTMEPTSPVNLFTSLAPGLGLVHPLTARSGLSGPGSLSELSELSRLRLSTGSPALSGSQISGSYLGGSLNDLRITAGSQVILFFHYFLVKILAICIPP